MQKTEDESTDRQPRSRTASDRLPSRKPEAVWWEGVQSYIEIDGGRLVEVVPDDDHLPHYILSPRNIGRAISRVVPSGGSGGVDGMGVEELRTYWEAHGEEIKALILEGKYKPSAVRRQLIPKGGGKMRKARPYRP